MKVAAASVLAASTEGVNAKIFDTESPKHTKEGIAIRFLGTGAADWRGVTTEANTADYQASS